MKFSRVKSLGLEKCSISLSTFNEGKLNYELLKTPPFPSFSCTLVGNGARLPKQQLNMNILWDWTHNIPPTAAAHIAPAMSAAP